MFDVFNLTPLGRGAATLPGPPIITATVVGPLLGGGPICCATERNCQSSVTDTGLDPQVQVSMLVVSVVD